MGRRLSMYTQSANSQTKESILERFESCEVALESAGCYSACCYLGLKDILFFFSSRVKFDWNASNRIKDFWSATRMPFQSKHYAEGELSYCSTPLLQQRAVVLTSFQLCSQSPSVSAAPSYANRPTLSVLTHLGICQEMT